MGTRTSLTLAEGMTGITENAFINIKGRSHSVTADVEVPRGGANGVIIAQAGRFGGWSLYMKDGRVHEVYNYGGLEWSTVSSPAALAPGRHTIRYDFVYDGGKPGSGGTSRLSVDGKPAGEARVARTMPFMYSADEGVDVGMDNGDHGDRRLQAGQQQVHRPHLPGHDRQQAVELTATGCSP